MKRFVYCIICFFLITCSKNILEENTQLPKDNLTEEYPLIFEPYPDIRSVNKFKGNENICSIHFTKMKNQKVRITYGLPADERSSYEFHIREKLFPNCDDPVWGGCVFGYERYTEIKICENCNIDRDKWMKENWEAWKEEHRIIWKSDYSVTDKEIYEGDC